MNYIKQYKYLILCVCCIIIRVLLSYFPSFSEKYYTNGLFKLLRFFFDTLSSYSKIPLVYFLFFFLFALSIRYVYILHRSQKPRLYTLLLAIKSFMLFLCLTISLFLILWGFNYANNDIEQKLNLTVEKISIQQLRTNIIELTSTLSILRESITNDTSSLTHHHLPDSLFHLLQPDIKQTLTQFKLPVVGSVMCRELYPKGILLRLSTAGIYIPFVGEGHIDAGLHALQKPFTFTHEVMHGQSITDEGDCNFLAYITCINSKHTFIQYSAYLTYFRYLASDYAFYAPDDYKIIRNSLPIGIKNDLNAINNEMNKYPDLFPQLRDATYDAFLRMQGIKEGIGSYNRIIYLIEAWKHKKQLQK